jgi:hypothetical protein
LSFFPTQRSSADRGPLAQGTEEFGRDQRSVCNGRFALHFLSPLCTNGAGAYFARFGDGRAPPQQPGIIPRMEIWKT